MDVVEPHPDDCGCNFRKADFDGLNTYLDLIDWEVEYRGCAGVDETFDRFYKLLTRGSKLFVPLRKFSARTHPPWYTKRLLN